MRRLESEEDKKKKTKRNHILIGIILVAVMVISTAGYALYNTGTKSESKKLTYKSVNFVKGDDGYWHFSNSKGDFTTKFNPDETENISASVSLSLNSYTNAVVYFVAESSGEFIALDDIANNLQPFVLRAQYACLAGSECKRNLPEKNCSENVIIVRETNSSASVYQTNRCIFINGQSLELDKASDAFLFKILGL